MLMRIILYWLWSRVFYEAEAVINNVVAEGISRKFMAAILKRETDLIHCGGSVLMADIILTACACVHGRNNQSLPTSDYYVVAGTIAINSEYRQKSDFKKFLPHPKCDVAVLPPRVDVALAYLVTPFKLTQYFKPIKFVSRIRPTMWWYFDRMTSINRICETPGWGISSFKKNAFPPVELRYGLFKLMPESDCKRLACEMYNYCVPSLAAFHQSCGVAHRGAVICTGDTGGPVTCNEDFYGITSFGHPDCLAHSPNDTSKLFPVFFCDPMVVLQFIRMNVPSFKEEAAEEKEIRSKVPPTKYPFVVNIANISNPHIPLSLCAGSILTKKDVLTTCSCMKPLKFSKTKGHYKDVAVIFGKINLFLSAKNEQRLKIKEVALDNSCELQNGTVYYDVALAIVDGQFNFNENTVQPVRFKTINIEALKQALADLQLKYACYMATWGYSTERPTQLRHHVFAEWKVQVFHIDSCLDEFCEFNSPLCNETINDREETCGRAYDPSQPCFADTGAPLICEGYFFGVVSRTGQLCWSGNKIKIVTAMTVMSLILKKYPDFKLELPATTRRPTFKPSTPKKQKQARAIGNRPHLLSALPFLSALVLVGSGQF